MSITLDTGTVQTTSVPTRTPKMPAVGGIAYKIDDPGNSVAISVTSPLDQEGTLRHAYQKIANLFKGTNLVPKVGQRVDGVQILSQITETWKFTNTDDGSTEYFPVSAHVVVKLPVHPTVTKTVTAALLDRLYGSMQRVATTSLEDSIDPLLRGVTRL